MKTYTTPAVPKAPALPADLASELSAYDASEPSLAAADIKLEEHEEDGGAEAFLEFLEADLPHEEHHH